MQNKNTPSLKFTYPLEKIVPVTVNYTTNFPTAPRRTWNMYKTLTPNIQKRYANYNSVITLDFDNYFNYITLNGLLIVGVALFLNLWLYMENFMNTKVVLSYWIRFCFVLYKPEWVIDAQLQQLGLESWHLVCSQVREYRILLLKDF